MKLTPLIEGAPNFRQIPGLPVYGVAIPTVLGLRLVLEKLGASSGRKVLWHNLREEPVLYINGRPFVVREADKPFANLEYTGIDRYRVEEMEARLKQDVLEEAKNYSNQILVADEDDQFQVLEHWEPVSEADVQTPLEVYEELASESGFDVDYLRVPITDEKAPKDDDFETLIKRCWQPPLSAALVFNCQMGRGRTTTGTVIGSLLYLRSRLEDLALPLKPQDGFPEWFSSGDEVVPDVVLSPRGNIPLHSEEELKAGKYGTIRSLLRVLEHGKKGKRVLDVTLDACSAMQNLREAIAGYRKRIFTEANDMQRQSLLQVCIEYLERYFVLIAFTAYLNSPGFSPGRPNHISFSAWTAARPELRSILERLLRGDPLKALGLSLRAGEDVHNTFSLQDASALEDDQMTLFVAHRDGAVLGPYTILKSDHFPGCHSSRLPLIFPGAPNFRAVPGVGIFGGAIPTIDGIRSVLKGLGAAPSKEMSRASESPGSPSRYSRRRTVWHLMREEPVVYINGSPYVLREASRPFKNLLEYRGIDAERIESMEERLREDLLREAAKNGGQVLVMTEKTINGSSSGVGDEESAVVTKDVQEEFISLTAGPDSVATPRQVYRRLAEEGYQVTLVRVPLTDGTAPKPKDFDAFYSSAAGAGPGDALIYTCQLGGGRTTTGMVIGTLLRIFLNGASLGEELEPALSLQHLDEDVGAMVIGSSDDERDDADREEYEFPSSGIGIGGTARAPPPPTTTTTTTTTTAAAAGTPPISLGTSPTSFLDLEVKNLRDGEYVAVRRFTRILERGPEAKATTDRVIDECGLLINLRTAIMRYRKPKDIKKFFRPEIQARHAAFQRGCAYLERYCMMIAFTVYLRYCQSHGRRYTFEEWVLSRPDLASSRDFIHQNPAGALAPLPPVLPLSPKTSGGEGVLAAAAGPATGRNTIPGEEERRVLLKRKGSTVGRRSILKTLTFYPSQRRSSRLSLIHSQSLALDIPPKQLHHHHHHNNSTALHPTNEGVGGVAVLPSIDGLADIRKVEGQPVYTIGNATVSALRELLAHFGGDTDVVITDLREELVLYVNGTAYLRRELEMPAAALHHAGIQASRLEELEKRLEADMLSEAATWGGKLLLHREVYQPSPPPHLQAPHDDSDGEEQEDVTRPTESRAQDKVSPRVVAFWEHVLGEGGNINLGLATPALVFSSLAEEGFVLKYRRIPMSRERTPQAADLDQLLAQMASTSTRASQRTVFVFISRTATGSSVRFASAAATTYLGWKEYCEGRGVSPSSAGPAGSSWGPRMSPPSRLLMRELSVSEASDTTSLHGDIPRSSMHLPRTDSELSELVRNTVAGEYRGIMNLCRVLPGGAEAKGAVDSAMDACSASIGNVKEDIYACKQAVDCLSGGMDGERNFAARRLGLHYLQRYFYLISFRVYLETGLESGATFSRWFGDRKELQYLLKTLDLE